MTTQAETQAGHAPNPSTGQLVSQLSAELSTLVRDEMRLAQAELSGKAKRAGLGAGLFGAAGIVALFGAGTLVTAAVLALDLVWSAWLAALVVGAALLLIAAVMGLAGKSQVTRAVPPAPTEAIDGVRKDVQTLKGGAAR